VDRGVSDRQSPRQADDLQPGDRTVDHVTARGRTSTGEGVGTQCILPTPRGRLVIGARLWDAIGEMEGAGVLRRLPVTYTRNSTRGLCERNVAEFARMRACCRYRRRTSKPYCTPDSARRIVEREIVVAFAKTRREGERDPGASQDERRRRVDLLYNSTAHQAVTQPCGGPPALGVREIMRRRRRRDVRDEHGELLFVAICGSGRSMTGENPAAAGSCTATALRREMQRQTNVCCCTTVTGAPIGIRMGVGDGSGDTGVVLTPPPPHDRRAAAVASVKAAGESHTPSIARERANYGYLKMAMRR